MIIVKSREITPRWSLTMTGAVTARDVHGKAALLSTRKAAGVLAVLAAAEGKPVTRELLEEALWPGVDPERRSQSLRNALSGIRKCFGEDGPVEISRRTCRLRLDQIESDFPPETQEGWIQLATDQDGSWFEHLRQGRVRLTPLVAKTEGPEEMFAKVLNWAADHDPERALDLMRAAPELATQIPGLELTELVDRLWRHVEPSRPLFGWLIHFRGITEYLRGEVKAGLRSFTLAAQAAMTSGDTRLLGESVRWFSAPRIVMGDAKGAAVVIEKSLEMAAAQKDDDAVSLLLHAKGVAALHLGRSEEADASLVQALEGSYYRRNTVARMQLLANLVLFRAVENDREGVAEIFREIGAVERASENWRVDAAGHLARAILHLFEDENLEAEQELAVILDRASEGRGQFSTIDIYAREYAGVACVQRGDLDKGRRHFEIANEMRNEREMGLTAWDRKRLGASMKALRAT
jgi:tetratricopeptide (TPR) repeat protein